MKPPFLEGKRMFLSSLTERSDFKRYVRWLNDQESTLFMGSGRFPLTAEDLKSYVTHYNKSKDGMVLGIFLKRTGEHIGNVTLHQIDYRNQFGEVGIIIGEKKSWGKGYATECLHLITNHAFSRINLNKICAGIVHGNVGSLKAFQKVGFKIEGTLKEHFYLHGKFLPVYRLGLLRKDY